MMPTTKNPTISPFGKFWLKQSLTSQQEQEGYKTYLLSFQHKHASLKESKNLVNATSKDIFN
jgi:hypothetical protein